VDVLGNRIVRVTQVNKGSLTQPLRPDSDRQFVGVVSFPREGVFGRNLEPHLKRPIDDLFISSQIRQCVDDLDRISLV